MMDSYEWITVIWFLTGFQICIEGDQLDEMECLLLIFQAVPITDFHRGCIHSHSYQHCTKFPLFMSFAVLCDTRNSSKSAGVLCQSLRLISALLYH